MLAYKQLTKQILSNRIFIILLTILTILTSLSFFFVRFTIDGNKNRMNEIAAGGGDIVKYQTATSSNTTLAYVFLAACTLLTAFVFLLFYYRFFRSGRKQIGCLKALGYQDAQLRNYFVGFTAVLSLIGGLIGLVSAYPLSRVLLQANIDSYGVSGLVRSLHISTILFCFIISIGIFSLAAFFSYGYVKGKEPGDLIAGNLIVGDGSKWSKYQHGFSQKLADRVVDTLPTKNKFPVRMILRKPVTMLLILIAVISYSVFMILAYSLNISSQKVYTSQTQGHNYEFSTSYAKYLSADTLQNDNINMLSTPVNIQHAGTDIQYDAAGLYQLNELYELQDAKGNLLDIPAIGSVSIGQHLSEVYDIKIGERISITVEDKALTLKVTAIAANSIANTVFINGTELANLMEVPDGSYNLVLSNHRPSQPDGETISNAEKIEQLERDAVSNKVSGVINQLTGVVVGCILIFLALYMSFQDNMRDMLILDLIGYRPKTIRRMFISIYRPLIWIFFVLTLFPSILIVQAVQKNLSVTTGDYMPFGTSIWVILLAFVVLTLLYQLVQLVFGGMLKRISRKEESTKYISVD